MLADIALRRRTTPRPTCTTRAAATATSGCCRSALIVVGTAVGWGLVTNTYAGWLTWQGYLLGPLGLGGKAGAWAFANLGVLVALVIGFVGTLAIGAGRRSAPRKPPAGTRPPRRRTAAGVTRPG